MNPPHDMQFPANTGRFEWLLLFFPCRAGESMQKLTFQDAKEVVPWFCFPHGDEQGAERVARRKTHFFVPFFRSLDGGRSNNNKPKPNQKP